MNQLKSGKAPRVCGIYAEMLRAGELPAPVAAHSVMFHLEHGDHPDRLETGGVVVPLPSSIWKGKIDTQECNNYRGVTLLSVPGKVL